VLADVLHSIRFLHRTSTNATPHERFFLTAAFCGLTLEGRETVKMKCLTHFWPPGGRLIMR